MTIASMCDFGTTCASDEGAGRFVVESQPGPHARGLAAWSCGARFAGCLKHASRRLPHSPRVNPVTFALFSADHETSKVLFVPSPPRLHCGRSIKLAPPSQVIAPSQTASALLHHSLHLPRFSCACAALDQLVSPPPLAASHPSSLVSTSLARSNGLAQGSILELIGPPGSGKTRTALGYVLNTRFNAIVNQDDDGESARDEPSAGEVLVIDAEGSLLPSLMHKTASLYAEHNGGDANDVSLVLSGIHYRRITDVSLLIALLYSLPSWLASHPRVTLLILDSLTSHLRPTSLDAPTRSYILQLLRTTLHRLTSQHGLTIILTSALSLKLFSPTGEPTTFGHASRDAEALLVPQLGESWIPINEGVPFYRIVLYFDLKGERLARLLVAPITTRKTEGEFTMDALGPCDHPRGAPIASDADD